MIYFPIVIARVYKVYYTLGNRYVPTAPGIYYIIYMFKPFILACVYSHAHVNFSVSMPHHFYLRFNIPIVMPPACAYNFKCAS